MKHLKRRRTLVLTLVCTLMCMPLVEAQKKKRLKRPSSRVGIYSVDSFVQNSFDIYDKVYMYDGYAEQGKPLTDDDIDVLERALDDLADLSASTPDILSDIDGANALKKAKATLQINRAKKALSYSIKTAKRLLSENKKDDESENDETSSEDETSSSDDASENDGTSDDDSSSDGDKEEDQNLSDNLEVYSKFDFVPGDKLLYFDDFSQDFIGDFPSKWNTNGSGEVVQFNQVEGKWFQLKSGYGVIYLPIMDALPEEYTIEFDILVQGIDKQTSSTAMLQTYISDNNTFRDNRDYLFSGLPLGQYGAFDIRVTNRDKTNPINTALNADIRQDILNKPHISIAVNKKRFRLWVNQTKHVDIPQFIYAPDKLKYLKFNVKGLKEGKEKVFISNLKIAEGGVDLRRKLMAEGRISTNGILFDSGSANIKPQSFGIIRQISQVLMQDVGLRLNIIGHTDADGSEDANLKLSKDRADAVKNALIEVYNISSDRLATEGKGESAPVADNATTDGKAQNRRVEFVKIN